MEDNPADAGLVRKALEEHGVEGELTVLNDGAKAVEFIRTLDAQALKCPDLFIIDLNLPKKPGQEVLKFIRQSETCPTVPVVILSSSDALRDRENVAKLGATRYLQKPSSLEEFLALGAIFKETLGQST